MAKKIQAKPRLKKDGGEDKIADLVMQEEQHLSDSDRWISNLRDGWSEKELMLIGQTDDQLSKQVNSKVYEPRLSTIAFERAARVMAQNPRGKFYAVSEDDIGKTLLMNLLTDFFRKRDKRQFSHLIKFRMLDLYSLVYGSMFMLVPWRVDLRTGQLGPSTEVLPMRDCFPQPGVRNLNEADWFIVRNEVSIEWLKKQDPEIWRMDDIERLDKDLKERRSTGSRGKSKNSNHQSEVERIWYPTVVGDVQYPAVEIFTAYKRDQWITFAPSLQDEEKGHPYCLRLLDDPYPDNMLPVVAKHAFPLLDSPIGLGEFERGKTLQYALNSLWNLYLDGVKYSIFPPMAIDPSNVVPTSIKWNHGARWFMNNPGRDVQPVPISPQGLNSFQSTYNYLIGAIHSQAGSTNISAGGEEGATLGRTPQALKLYAAAEGARDEWDRFMMEEAIQDVYERWGALTTTKLETKISLRLFGDEIEQIRRDYDDVDELLDNRTKTVAGRKVMKVGKKDLDSQYDFELETGSTLKPSLEQEGADLTEVLKAFLDNPQLLERMREKGKDIDFGELIKRWVQLKVKDADKVILDYKPVQADAQDAGGGPGPEGQSIPGQQPIPGGAGIPPEAGGGQIPPQAGGEAIPPTAEAGPGDVTQNVQFNDPEIAEAAAAVLQGGNFIPPTNSASNG